jgi:hypothetical protein
VWLDWVAWNTTRLAWHGAVTAASTNSAAADANGWRIIKPPEG